MTTSRLIAALALLMLFREGLAAAPPPALDASVPAHFVVRVYYENLEDIGRLVDYDVWEFNDLEQRYVLVSVDRSVYARLAAEGWRLAIDRDATAMIDPERLRLLMDAYRNVDELYADVDAIAQAHPDIVEIVDYGDSYCKIAGGCVTLGGDAQPGYDLRALRITHRGVPGPKPVFFLMANIHAREITTPEIAMRWIELLAERYGVNADVTWMVDHHELWVVPVVNPDGRWLVDLGLLPLYGGSRFFQRKNADRDNGCNTWPPASFSQYGVDLNRNHSFEWNTGGSSGSPCSETYRGPLAASEPEVSQLQDLVLSLIPDQRGDGFDEPAPASTEGLFITLHSFGNWVLRPWGTLAQPAPNEAGLAAIGDKLATYNGYTSCQIRLCLYETSGTSCEWAYGELGVPAFTFELGNEFMPDYSVIDSQQWPDNAPALLYAARIARSPYRLALGPDALRPQIRPLDANRVLLRAVVNDTKNGGRNIRQAFYAIDVPYWQPGFTPVAMRPADGLADSPVELFRAAIDTSGLTPGRHTVYVHGVDVDDNLGPPSALFLDIP